MSINYSLSTKKNLTYSLEFRELKTNKVYESYAWENKKQHRIVIPFKFKYIYVNLDFEVRDNKGLVQKCWVPFKRLIEERKVEDTKGLTFELEEVKNIEGQIQTLTFGVLVPKDAKRPGSSIFINSQIMILHNNQIKKI